MLAFSRLVSEAEKELDRIELLALKAIKSSEMEEMFHSKNKNHNNHLDRSSYISFEYQFIELAEKVKRLSKLCQESTSSTDQLQRLEAIHGRWRVLRTQTKNCFINESDVHHNYQLSYPWERSTNEHGIPYYTNHHTKSTQWEHPVLQQLLKALNDRTMSVHFVAYKIALKLREIQKILMLDRLSSPDIIQEFNKVHQPGSVVLNCCQVSKALQSLYTPLLTSAGRAVLSDLTLNWINRLYDCQHTGNLHFLSPQIALILLSQESLEEKYFWLFELMSQETPGEVDMERLTHLLNAIQQVPRELGDLSAFGSEALLEASVRDCLGAASLGVVDITNWSLWTSGNPQFLAWIALISKVKDSEQAVHNVKCVFCKTHPIIGFLYSCTECLFHNVCQTCFLKGLNYKLHNPSHQIAEHCCQTSYFTLIRLRLLSKLHRNNSTNNGVRYHNRAVSAPNTPILMSLKANHSHPTHEQCSTANISRSATSEMNHHQERPVPPQRTSTLSHHDSNTSSIRSLYISSPQSFSLGRIPRETLCPPTTSSSSCLQNKCGTASSNSTTSSGAKNHLEILDQQTSLISHPGNLATFNRAPSPIPGATKSDVERRMEFLEHQNRHLIVQLDCLREMVGHTPISSNCSSMDGDQPLPSPPTKPVSPNCNTCSVKKTVHHDIHTEV